MKFIKELNTILAIILAMLALAYITVTHVVPAYYAMRPAAAKKNLLRLPIQIVNLSGTNGTRYLKIELSLEYATTDEAASALAFEANKTIMNDTLIMLLSSKTIATVDGYENKEILKEEIRQKFHKILALPKEVLTITAVYYQTFLIQ